MILDLCGGTPSEPLLAGTVPEPRTIVDFPYCEVKRLSGLSLSNAEIKGILTRLGFWVAGTEGVVKVAAPSWRPDIEGKADLVEEVMRIAGVDQIPSTPLPRGTSVGQKVLTAGQIRRNQARRTLAVRGMKEAVTWSFISREQAEAFGGGAAELKLANPISADMSDMRPSLIPGLAAAAQRNADRGYANAALFEVGQIFTADTPEGQAMVAAGARRGTAVMTGADRHWSANAPTVSVFDAKADAEAVLASIGAPVDKLMVFAQAPAWYHPGRSGELRLGPKTVLARFGELHPGLLEKLDIGGPIAAFEVFIDAVPEGKAKASRSKGALQISDFMPVRRDFAFIVDGDVTADRLLKAARGAEKQLISDVTLFDIYTGQGVPEGKKSLAIDVTLQPRQKTMTEEEIDAVAAKIVASVEKATGGTLRG